MDTPPLVPPSLLKRFREGEGFWTLGLEPVSVIIVFETFVPKIFIETDRSGWTVSDVETPTTGRGEPRTR